MVGASRRVVPLPQREGRHFLEFIHDSNRRPASIS